MMKWHLTTIERSTTPFTFEETVDLKQELVSRCSDIMDVSTVTISGMINMLDQGYLVSVDCKTTLTLPSTRSLTPVTLPIHIVAEELYQTPEQFHQVSTLEDSPWTVSVMEQRELDIKEMIVDYILLAIPSQVLTEQEQAEDAQLPHGEFWEVLTETEYQKRQEEKQQEVDPRLAGLSQLLNDLSDDSQDHKDL